MKPPPEQNRLRFVFERDGLENAIKFAKCTMISYRRIILQRGGLCSTRTGRIEYVKSYKAFKEFIARNEGMVGVAEKYDENIP